MKKSPDYNLCLIEITSSQITYKAFLDCHTKNGSRSRKIFDLF